MLDNVAPLWLWVAKSVQSFQDYRAAFDRHELRPGKAGLPLGMNGTVASLRDKRNRCAKAAPMPAAVEVDEVLVLS
jgi:hypothetical protein